MQLKGFRNKLFQGFVPETLTFIPNLLKPLRIHYLPELAFWVNPAWVKCHTRMQKHLLRALTTNCFVVLHLTPHAMPSHKVVKVYKNPCMV